jgi:hypothetical protein
LVFGTNITEIASCIRRYRARCCIDGQLSRLKYIENLSLSFLGSSETQMAKSPASIDQLRIATPCPISWEQMTGDNRVRFCDHCQLNVYNISALSHIEAEKLIASTEGRLCARLFRRADGTVLTKDCPVGLRALRRRVAKRAAAMFAAIVSLSAVALGQHGSTKDGKTGCAPQTKITYNDATSDTHEKVLSGRLVDPAGAPIPRAKVQLINSNAKEIRETCTNDDGVFEFTPIASGKYLIKIEAIGFKNYEFTDVLIKEDKLTKFEGILEPDSVEMGVVLLEPSLLEVPQGTMIINETMIKRLPHQK